MANDSIGNILEQGGQQARGDIQKYYQEGLGYQQPYYQAGLQGLASLQDLMRNPSQIEQTPGYQFRLAEGQRAVESSSAARGLGLSGATLKALTRYGSNLASQEYGAEYSRRAGMANYGQTASGVMSSLASQTGGQTADVAIQIANARAAQIAANQQAASNRSSGLLGLLGGVGGFLIGGPAGAMVGASLGGSLGRAL
jgi:hypothetical protein